VALRLDYAYYNPASLVLREQKWLETELAHKGVTVSWQLSAGSNKANEALRAEAIDVGSTAGAAALVARANGAPIKTIDVFSQPEWAAIVVPKGSTVTSVAQLKGRKIAATKGTDPYFFLLQALDEAGLKPADVTVTNLQHADGKTALERGDVDAWAGLDPLMATSEVDAGSKLIYRNVGFNSYGVLNAREAFLAEHPDLAQAVVNAYEKARQWIKDNPDQAVALYAREAKISEQVAKAVLTERTRLDVDPVPGAAQKAVFEKILPVLVADANVKNEADARTAIDTLFEPKYATARSVS
ncbi:MAG TPA: aliphatic sulfonate ABC transporter substrate-binding protein, partial [Actinoplanes sp.]|nr:aliphatic sulfonate ABC transporter substrate-binding protein [Actinoplanes sp.]